MTDDKAVILTKTVTIPESEYHALQLVANNAKRDYLAIQTKNFDNVPTSFEWASAIESLEN